MPRIGGFKVPPGAAEAALKRAGLEDKVSVKDLVEASAQFDDTDPGELSATELDRGALALVGVLDAEYAPDVLRRVKKTVFGDTGPSDLSMLRTATDIDEGAGYLNRYELMMAATKMRRGDGTMAFVYKGKQVEVDAAYNYTVDGKPAGEIEFGYGDDGTGYGSPKLPGQSFQSEEHVIRGLIDAGVL